VPDYTILLIDYDPRSIDAIRGPLELAGYRVEIARDGLSGIRRFHQSRPDLTLIEAMIPKKHGFDVCEELKRTPHGRRTPVLIATSVYRSRKYAFEARHLRHCDDYLIKPISGERLVEIVGDHLARAASRRAESDAEREADPAAERTILPFAPETVGPRDEPPPPPPVIVSGPRVEGSAAVQPMASQAGLVLPRRRPAGSAAPRAPRAPTRVWMWIAVTLLGVLGGLLAFIVLT
jgi:CheY-like chemotaxis protein